MRPLLAALLLSAVPLPAFANFHFFRRPAPVQANYYYPTPAVYWPAVPLQAAPVPIAVQPPFAVAPFPAPPPILTPAPLPLAAAPRPSFPPAPVPFSPLPAPLATPEPAPASLAPLPSPPCPLPPAPPPAPAPAPPPTAIPVPAPASPPGPMTTSRFGSLSAAEQDGPPYRTYPSATSRRAPAGDQVSLSFWNLADRALVLKVDGVAYLMPAGRNLQVTARRQFVWQVAGREAERGVVPEGDSGLTVIVRR